MNYSTVHILMKWLIHVLPHMRIPVPAHTRMSTDAHTGMGRYTHSYGAEQVYCGDLTIIYAITWLAT